MAQNDKIINILRYIALLLLLLLEVSSLQQRSRNHSFTADHSLFWHLDIVENPILLDLRPISKQVCSCRGRPTDMYALGACLYTFAFGRIPFNAPNVFKLFQIVQNDPLTFPARPQVSPLLQDLLLRLLHKVSIPSVSYDGMQHPYL